MSPARALAVARALRNRLQWGLHAGAIRAGDRMPSVRHLAAEFGVDTRTALRACALLAEEGLIEMRKRSGMYVSLPSSAPQPLSSTQRSVVDILLDGLSRGIAPARLPQALHEHCCRRSVRVACIESNADHAQAICGVVHDTYGVDAFPASVDEVLADPGAVMENVHAAVATAFHATEIVRTLEPLGLPVFTATIEPAQGFDFMRTLEKRPIYVIGTDRRWAERAFEVFDTTEIGPNLHLRVIGEDDLENIPTEAEVFATPAAAPQLGSLPIRDRVRVLRYTLSTREARGLISTIVAVNGGS